MSLNQTPSRSASEVNVQARITVRDVPNFHVYMRTLAACQHAEQSLGITCRLGVAANRYAVHVARNIAVSELPSDATHLFFVDNDVWLQRDAINLLLDVPCDIALGCYAQITKAGRIAPHIAIFADGQWLHEPFDGVRADVQWGGTGCMLIRREVFEALEFPWFQWPIELRDGKVKETSDDVDFCRRATSAGFTIGAHGNVFCGHDKQIDSAALIVPGWAGPQTLEEQEARRERPVVA